MPLICFGGKGVPLLGKRFEPLHLRHYLCERRFQRQVRSANEDLHNFDSGAKVRPFRRGVSDKAEQYTIVDVEPDDAARGEMERQVNPNASLGYIDNLSGRGQRGVPGRGYPDLQAGRMTFMNTAIHCSWIDKFTVRLYTDL